MRITITIVDTDEGGVRIDIRPPASELVDQIKGISRRPIASTSAAMYALGMATWANARSREMERQGKVTNIITLPPGTRLDG